MESIPEENVEPLMEDKEGEMDYDDVHLAYRSATMPESYIHPGTFTEFMLMDVGAQVNFAYCLSLQHHLHLVPGIFIYQFHELPQPELHSLDAICV